MLSSISFFAYPHLRVSESGILFCTANQFAERGPKGAAVELYLYKKVFREKGWPSTFFFLLWVVTKGGKGARAPAIKFQGAANVVKKIIKALNFYKKTATLILFWDK